MEFDLKPKADKSRTGRPAPDYFSWPIRLRLATLVAVLGLVFVAMFEAGKPETWERLGFFSATAVEPDKTADSKTGNFPSAESIAPQNHVERTAESANLPPAFDKFWSDQFGQLDSANRTLLFRWLHAARNQDKLNAADAANAVLLLENLNDAFELLTTSDPENVDDELKKQFDALSQLLLDNAIGNPRLSANMEPMIVLTQLQNLWDRLAFDTVDDRSSLNRSVETPAWIRAWQRVSDRPPADAFEDVSYIQLAGQPEAWRGKLIRVRGEVRGIEAIELKGQVPELDSYNALWIKPVDSNRTPYCVYVRSLPDGFPKPDRRFQQVQEPVVVDGIFFKLRSYPANNNQIEICPLIVADTIQWNPATVPTPAATWSPPWWLLALFFIGMPIVAAGLAMRVYRSTKGTRFVMGRNRQLEIHETLAGLRGDRNVKTDQEKVRELSDSSLAEK